MAIERNPPKGVEGIKWTLLTNMEINNTTEAIEKVKLYSLRWNVEVFHKILKSGFSIEKCQLRTGEKLKKYIAIKSILAWRIFWITRYFEKNQTLACTKVLSEFEWKILYIKFSSRNKKIPKKPPAIKQVYIWIGKLGGFIGRKNDGLPGITSIWRGWIQFMHLIENYLIFCG